MNNECCETCRYFYSVRKWPTYEEVLTHICTCFLIDEGADYIIEVGENDMCECYKRRTNYEASI